MLLYWKWPWSMSTAAGCSRAAARINNRRFAGSPSPNTKAAAIMPGMKTVSPIYACVRRVTNIRLYLEWMHT